MTNVVTNVKDIMELEKDDNFNAEKINPKLEHIFDFLMLKSLAKQRKDEITKYTEKNKSIRKGQTVLSGTRITTKELILLISENKEDPIKYILEQYPSIDCEEKIFYGALYEITKMNTLKYIIKVLLTDENSIR